MRDEGRWSAWQADSNRRRRNFGDAQTVVAVDNYDFAAGYDPPIEQDIHRFLYLTVEFDHGTGIQIQHLSQQQPSAAESQRDCQFDVQ